MLNKVGAFVLLLMLAFSQVALAGGGSTPSSGGSGRPRCAAYDTGYEEHGYHNTCAECNAEHHGSCVQRCYDYDYTCTATGTNDKGEKETTESFDRREVYARDQALERCYGLGLKNCSVSSCTENSTQTSSQTCR